mgnify:FL=1|jgi:hypothetical protein
MKEGYVSYHTTIEGTIYQFEQTEWLKENDFENFVKAKLNLDRDFRIVNSVFNKITPSGHSQYGYCKFNLKRLESECIKAQFPKMLLTLENQEHCIELLMELKDIYLRMWEHLM